MKTNLSVEEASQRWIREGKSYKDAINAWLDTVYIEDKENENPEPRETRTDLAELVIAQVEVYNKSGEYEKLRKLFPPDHEPLLPLFDKELFESVSNVLMLPDDRIVVKAGSKCYIIQEYTITELPELIAFGASSEKKEFAKAYRDHVEVKNGWDGETICILPYPNGYGKVFEQQFPGQEIDRTVFTGEGLFINGMQVFPGGKQVLLTTSRGVFVINADTYQLVHPFIPAFKEIEDPWIFWPKNTSNDAGCPYALFLHYSHADLSPDGQYIATGSQDSCHIVLKEENNSWIETAWIEPRSSYPNAAKFNYRISVDGQPVPALALSSCHYSASATIGILVKDLPGLNASGYTLDHNAIWVIDDIFWVHSLLDGKSAFVLGTNTGYVWIKWQHNNTIYLCVGGTILSMDNSIDRQQLIIGNTKGHVIKLRFSPISNPPEKRNNRKDPYLVTNTRWVDEIRYLFPKGKPPLIW